MLVFAEIILSIFKHFIDGNNTFGNKIHAFDFCNRRYIARLKIKTCLNRLAKEFCRNRRGCSAADNVLTFFGEEKRHHTVGIITVRRRAEEHIHWLSFSDANNTSCCIIAGLLSVKLITFIYEHSRQCFGGVSAVRKCFHKSCNILTLPTEVICRTNTGMRTTVTHSDKNIVFLQFDNRFINLFTADIHFGFGIVPNRFITDNNSMRIIVLNKFGNLIIL